MCIAGRAPRAREWPAAGRAGHAPGAGRATGPRGHGATFTKQRGDMRPDHTRRIDSFHEVAQGRSGRSRQHDGATRIRPNFGPRGVVTKTERNGEDWSRERKEAGPYYGVFHGPNRPRRCHVSNRCLISSSRVPTPGGRESRGGLNVLRPPLRPPSLYTLKESDEEMRQRLDQTPSRPRPDGPLGLPHLVHHPGPAPTATMAQLLDQSMFVNHGDPR